MSRFFAASGLHCCISHRRRFRDRFQATFCSLFGVGAVLCSGCFQIGSDPANVPEALNLPEIRQAYDMKQRLNRNTVEIKQAGKELDEVITRVSYELPVLTPSSPIDELIKSTRLLKAAADEILEKGPHYIQLAERMLEDLDGAPATFSGAAELFGRFAEEESYADIADDYGDVQGLFSELSERWSETHKHILDQHQPEELGETLRYIRHQRRFLDRLDAALCSLFDSPNLKELQSYIARIEAFSHRFENLKSRIKDLDQAIPTPGGEESVQPDDEKPHSNKVTRPDTARPDARVAELIALERKSSPKKVTQRRGRASRSRYARH